ncbi:TerD family protein [Succinimonas amylolytica]|uniref:TerD family protein n=1 Tax=Succinimonas amylolytica TaxID=83769 RepID=UPI000363329D|nr:TerD family protein [Succinimonas amylolytica]
MSVKLQKGQKVSLTKTSAGLSKVIVGLGWDEAPRQSSGGGGFLSSLFSGGGSGGSSIDCDAFALLLSDGKLQGKSDVVYFGNLEHKSGSVKHMGDNLTGAGEGDDEQIVINLDSVPAQYDRILMGVNIYSAQSRKQHFGMIRNAFIRLVDARTSQEMCIFNLTEDYSGMTAMVFGEVYRHNGEWKFNAIGQGTTDGSINEFIKRYA